MVEEKKFARPATLPPTLRPRARYLAYEVISEGKVEFADIINTIWFSCITLLGEKGTAESQIRIIKDTWNEAKKTGIIRVGHTAVEQVRASLALVNRIGDVAVIIRVLGVSGSVKGVKKKFFGELDLESFA